MVMQDMFQSEEVILSPFNLEEEEDDEEEEEQEGEEEGVVEGVVGRGFV